MYSPRGCGEAMACSSARFTLAGSHSAASDVSAEIFRHASKYLTQVSNKLENLKPRILIFEGK
jgi:hypothetical protein